VDLGVVEVAEHPVRLEQVRQHLRGAGVEAGLHDRPDEVGVGCVALGRHLDALLVLLLLSLAFRLVVAAAE